MGTRDAFEASKRSILLSITSPSCDRSPKGSIDEPIRALLALINGEETGYVSTSSCSGRIVLFLSGVEQPTWLLVEHEPVTARQVHESLDKWIATTTRNSNNNNNSEVEDCRVEMKFEPLILHIQARDLSAAQALLKAALQAGFRESGIICGNRSGRIMVAVRTLSPLISTPVVVGGELIAPRGYLERLTDECNEAFCKNAEKTRQLEASFHKLLVQPFNEQQPKGAAISPYTKPWKRDLAIPTLHRYGHCVLYMVGIDYVIVLCGYGASADGVDQLVHRRSDVVALRDNNWVTLRPTDLDSMKVPLARESAAAVALGDNVCLMFGGRSSPSNPFGDVWRCIVNEDSVEWELLDLDSLEGSKRPSPRWGHSMHVLSPAKVLIVGGRDNDNVFDDLYLLSLEEGGGVHCRTIVWSRLKQTLPRPSFYHAGSCIRKCGGPVAIHGGLSDLDESSALGTTAMIIDVVTYEDVRVYAPKVQFKFQQDQLHLSGRCSRPRLTSWFAHTATILAPNTIVFVGGVFLEAESQGIQSAEARIQQCVDGSDTYSWEWVNYHTDVNMEDDAGLMAHGGVVTMNDGYVLNIGGGMLIGGFGPRFCSCWRADIDGLQVHCLMAARSDVKLIKVALEQCKLLDKTRHILYTENSNSSLMTYILPLVQSATLMELNADDCLHSLISERRALPVTDSEHPSVSTLGSAFQKSPLCKLKRQLQGLLKGTGATTSEAFQLISIVIQKRPEMLGDVAIVDESMFKGEKWNAVPQDYLWNAIATFCRASRVALWAEVDSGPMRQSHHRIVWPKMCREASSFQNQQNNKDKICGPGAPGWVEVVEYGVVQGFDLTATMFSRNNIREKKRMGDLNLAGEIVVDLFAGIGYWTLQLLKRSNASFVHACDINPDSIAALRYNLIKNGVDNRCAVHLGDNRITAPPLGRIADRVILGLLPSSRDAWPVACAVLSDKGGWLHVHGNCRRGEEASWSKDCIDEILRILGQRPPSQDQKQGEWQVRCAHIERVKSYAPHVYHFVADIYCSCTVSQPQLAGTTE